MYRLKHRHLPACAVTALQHPLQHTASWAFNHPATLLLVCLRRYLLPPIIFYAGLSVKKKQFFRNFATISAFGILGTYVAFAVIALALYAVAQLPNSLNLSVRASLLTHAIVAEKAQLQCSGAVMHAVAAWSSPPCCDRCWSRC